MTQRRDETRTKQSYDWDHGKRLERLCEHEYDLANITGRGAVK